MAERKQGIPRWQRGSKESCRLAIVRRPAHDHHHHMPYVCSALHASSSAGVPRPPGALSLLSREDGERDEQVMALYSLRQSPFSVLLIQVAQASSMRPSSLTRGACELLR